jgi:hypothetical protein
MGLLHRDAGSIQGCPKHKGVKGGPTTTGAQTAAQKCDAVLEVTVLASNLEALFRSETCKYPDLRSHGTPVRLGTTINPPSGAPPGERCDVPPTLEEIP